MLLCKTLEIIVETNIETKFGLFKILLYLSSATQHNLCRFAQVRVDRQS